MALVTQIADLSGGQAQQAGIRIGLRQPAHLFPTTPSGYANNKIILLL